MNQEITCPKCSYKFALDEALNRDIELQVRKQLSEEFRRKEGELRRELSKEAAEKAERSSVELQAKVEAQAKELKEARDQERALLHKKAELEERAEKAQLEAQRDAGSLPEVVGHPLSDINIFRTEQFSFRNARTRTPDERLRTQVTAKILPT